jgi:hypothetical protein
MNISLEEAFKREGVTCEVEGCENQATQWFLTTVVAICGSKYCYDSMLKSYTEHLEEGGT